MFASADGFEMSSGTASSSLNAEVKALDGTQAGAANKFLACRQRRRRLTGGQPGECFILSEGRVMSQEQCAPAMCGP
jgi:hypothetical protein